MNGSLLPSLYIYYAFEQLQQQGSDDDSHPPTRDDPTPKAPQQSPSACSTEPVCTFDASSEGMYVFATPWSTLYVVAGDWRWFECTRTTSYSLLFIYTQHSKTE
jgi:hypothetical protein